MALGNTAVDAIKYMRDTAILAGTDVGSRIYISIAPQSSTFPRVVMDIISREESPTQDSGSACDYYRIQVDVHSKQSRDISERSAFVEAHDIAFALRQTWSRTTSNTGDYDNAIDSIQEVDHRTGFLTDLDVYVVSNDYIVRMVGEGTTIETDGVITVRSNVIYRTKVTLTYEDFATAATTNTINLGFTLPAGGELHRVTMQPVTLFSGGALSGYSIKVGKTGDLDKYLMDQSVFTGATLPLAVQLSNVIESMTTTTVLKATATSTGANLSAATAGEVDIFIYYSIIS